MRPATAIGRRQTRRYLRSLPISCARSARYQYGRKTYETMAVWETPDVIPGLTPAPLEFARIWQVAEKIVYSKTLETVSTPKMRLEQEFDPQVVGDLKGSIASRCFGGWYRPSRPCDPGRAG